MIIYSVIHVIICLNYISDCCPVPLNVTEQNISLTDNEQLEFIRRKECLSNIMNDMFELLQQSFSQKYTKTQCNYEELHNNQS